MIIRFDRFRVSCPECGVVTESLDFMSMRGPWVTHPLAQLVNGLCKITTHNTVGFLFGHPGNR